MVRRILGITALGVTVMMAAPAPAPAQMSPDSVAAQLSRLRARIDSLEALVRRLQEAGREGEAQSALEQLREAARAAAGGVAPDTAQQGEAVFVGRQRSLQALNPEISLNADLFGHVDVDDANADNFVAREFELSIQSTLDPYSRAKVFIAGHSPGAELEPFGSVEEGHEEEGGGVAVESGFVQWVNLPGGLGLTVGKFFQRLGTLNRWHGHALPFQSRSLPHLAFIGEEALIQSGASLYWLVPVHGAGTYEVSFEVTRSSNEVLFGESTRPSVLGHLNGFWQLNTSTDLDLGFSWLNGTYEGDAGLLDQDLYSAEMALTWRPPLTARSRELSLRGGVMVHDREDPDRDRTALGVWTMAELRLSPNWIVGGRYDWVENPDDPEQTAWLASPTLTWWQSEWVRLRAEYDFIRRTSGEDTGKFVLQITFAMGPHKHESY